MLRRDRLRPLLHRGPFHLHRLAADAAHEYGIKLSALSEMQELDALILAVSHKWYLDQGQAALSKMVRDGGVVAQGLLRATITSDNLSRAFGLPLQVTYADGRFAARATS